jgi:hypothetical protein
MLRNGELIFTLVIVSVSMPRLWMFARLRWRFAHWNLFHDGRSGLYGSTMPEPRRRFCDSRHALSLNLGLSRRHTNEWTANQKRQTVMIVTGSASDWE